MAIRIMLEDTSVDITIHVVASGGYSPDVIHDLQARAIDCYRLTLTERYRVLGEVTAAAEATATEASE